MKQEDDSLIAVQSGGARYLLIFLPILIVATFVVCVSGDRVKVLTAEHKYMRLLCLLSVKFYRFQCQSDRTHQKQVGERFQECEGQPAEQQPGAGPGRGQGSKGGE